MSDTMLFDTLEFSQDLQKVGVEPKVADAQARLQAKIWNNMAHEKFSTKDDFNSLQGDVSSLKDDVNLLREDLKKFATKEDLKRFATKEEMRQEIRAEVSVLESKMEQRFGKLNSNLMLGVAFVSILMTVFHFLS